MGFLDGMLSSITGQNNGQQGGSNLMDIMQYGVVGAKIKNSAEQNQREAAAREKPGSMCLPTCSVTGDACDECLKGQKDFLNSLSELQELEKTVDAANNAPLNTAEVKPSKCTLCGAPFDKGEKECPYCGTAYPAGTVIADIPATKPEQHQLLLNKASSTYKLFSDWFALRAKNQNSQHSGILGGVMQFVGSVMNNAVEMNPSQIQQGAQHYGVSFSEYISGIAVGNYLTVPTLQLQKQNEAMEEQRKQQEYYAQKSRAIEEERRAKVAAIRQDTYRRQTEMAVSRVADYGVGSHCCGTCAFYMLKNSQCAYNNYSTNANGHCGHYKMK